MRPIPIFYINLAHAVGRRAAMERQLEANNLEAIRVEAATPADITDAERAAYCSSRRHKWLAPAEFACTKSHFKAWTSLMGTGAPYGVVLEDDAVLSADLSRFLKAFSVEPYHDRNVVIKLETSVDPLRSERRPAAVVGGFELRRMFGFDGGSAAYIISAPLAAKLLTWDTVWHDSIDRVLFDSFRHSHPVKYLQVEPALAIQARKISGAPPEIEASAIVEALWARQKVGPPSRLAGMRFALKDMAHGHLFVGGQKTWVDLTGRKKRVVQFLP